MRTLAVALVAAALFHSLHAVAADALILSAPPREKDAAAREIYDPIAQYLSGAIGRNVIFRPGGTWGAYQSLMQQDKYDLVLDGPHFVAWRVKNLKHDALVKISNAFQFVVIVRKDSRAKSMRDLAGHLFCGSAPPNLGTLVVMSQFSPSRIPALRVVNGWKNIYNGLLDKKCEAAVLPKSNLLAFDRDERQVKIVYEHQEFPNNALSASPRVTAAEKQKIIDALLSPAAEGPLRAYRAKYMIDAHFVRANNAEFLPAANLLGGIVGF